MASSKEMAKNLKKPDALQRFGVHMTEWVLKNQKLLIVAGVAVVVATGAVFTYLQMQESARLGRIERVGIAELVQISEQKAFGDSQEKIQKEISDLNIKIAATDKKTKLSKKDKKQAEAKVAELEKQMQDAKPNYEKALQST